MKKRLFPILTLMCLSFLFSQCSREEIAPPEGFTDYNIEAQAQRTDALVIDAQVSYECDISDCEGYEYEFRIGGAGIDLAVNWGDGTKSYYVFDGEERITHNYAKRGRYTITVTGTLANVMEFRAGAYGRGDFRAINFAALPNVQRVDLNTIGHIAPVTIDLTKNPELRMVSAPASQYTWNFVLPRKHYINTIHIDGPSGLEANDVDKVISNIYANATSRNIRGGLFTLRAHLYENDDYATMGPPSEASLTKLRILRDSYDWFIYPLDGRPFDWEGM